MENKPNVEAKKPLADFSNEVLKMPSERKWAVSCYIPIFNIVTCVLTGVRMIKSKFCLFHARQGLALFGLWFFTILVALISQTLSLMLWGVVLLLHGYGIFLAFKNKTTLIPLLGNLGMKIPEDYMFKRLTGKIPEVNTSNDPPVPAQSSAPPVASVDKPDEVVEQKK